MPLHWPEQSHEAMRVWAEGCYPFEGCGVVLGVSEPGGVCRVRRFRPLANQLRDRDRASAGVLEAAADTLGARARTEGQFEFVMDPAEFNQAVLEGVREDWDVIGILHTHPDHPARPSATDAAQPLLSGWSNIIVRVDQGRFIEARSWRRDEESQPFQEEVIVIEKGA